MQYFLNSASGAKKLKTPLFHSKGQVNILFQVASENLRSNNRWWEFGTSVDRIKVNLNINLKS